VSPDLLTQVLISNLTWERARAIARATQVEGSVALHADGRPFWFLHPTARLSTWAVHDLLTDSADWNADSWDMEPARLSELVRALEILFEQIPEAFQVEVMWSGDRALVERLVTRDELLDVVRRGQIGTRVRYLVKAASESATISEVSCPS
jgi:hypothetical protein